MRCTCKRAAVTATTVESLTHRLLRIVMTMHLLRDLFVLQRTSPVGMSTTRQAS
jgi:hypothetical protein